MTHPFQEIKTAIKVLGLLLFTMATSFCSYAQENKDDDIDGLLDELFFNDQQFLDELIESDFSYSFLYTSVSYNSNTFFSGRDSGTDQFNMVPQVSYYHSSGFNASISGIYYENFAPSWDFTSVSAGYFNTLDKKKSITYNLGYTKYFYSDGYDGFTNSLDLSLGVRNKKRTLGSNISVSYLFGTEESYQLVSSSFVNLTLKRNQDFALRLRPRLNFIIAKQNITIDRIVVLANRTILRSFNFNVFDLLNTQINIPLSLSLKSWDFELGYNLNLPNALSYESDLETTSYFNFSVGYLFDLSKK
ncbi:hypothetical protein [Polaribacter sp. SA4-12]|uniref:hypothetical protein n=1 Tax=Polaribacter sp. SA4-12 TaxID=1312072 RepID=UPI001E5CBFDE|nr:hypothetical protein [Polaribacter sp. SA4-12]